MKKLTQEQEYRKLIQTALQDNSFVDNKLCDLNYLLYKVRLGGNALRMLTKASQIAKIKGSVTIEQLDEMYKEFLQETHNSYDIEASSVETLK